MFKFMTLWLLRHFLVQSVVYVRFRPEVGRESDQRNTAKQKLIAHKGVEFIAPMTVSPAFGRKVLQIASLDERQ